MNVTSSKTSNETESCVIETDFDTYIVYITVIISFVSICECLVVIFVTWFTENLHGNTCILVASLAANDLLLAVAFVANQISAVPLRLSHVMKSKLMICLIFGVSSGSTNLSVMHMGVIAVDRCIQIAHPFYYMKKMTKKRTYLTILGLWVIYLVFIIIPPTVYYDDKYHQQCMLLHQPVGYWSAGTSVYCISILTVFICYFKISHVAFKHKQSANSRRLRCNVSEADIELSDNVKAALRSVKFFALMFGVVFMCTFPPYFVTGLGFLYDISENIYVGLFSLMPIHSAINVLIYAYMNKEFSTSFVRNLLAIKARCCKDTREM